MCGGLTKVSMTPTSRRTPTSRKRRLRRAALVTALSVVLAGGGTAGWALNHYVLDHVQISDVDAFEASQAAATGVTVPAASGTDAGSDSGSDSGSGAADIDISTVTTGSGASTVTYYVADVTLSDATVLRSAFADNKFGTNIVQNTSDLAADNNALFAVNGDYYGFRTTGIVIRNGVVYRDSPAREGLALYRDGTVKVYDETATTAAQLVADGVWNTLSFGPALLIDGAVQTDLQNVAIDHNMGNRGIDGDNPRTAIGVLGPNHLAFVVVDGRSPGYSEGVTLAELATILKGLGAETAYNLDGGGSSTMVYSGDLVNNPLGKAQERGTSDILYIEA